MLGVLILVSLSFSAAAETAACTFSDVKNTDKDKAVFESICSMKLFMGTEKEGSMYLYPDNYFNRAEFATVLNRFITVKGGAKTDYSGQTHGDLGFKDLKGKTDAWFMIEILNATSGENAPFKGYPDGSFQPEKEINFVELVKTILLQGKKAELAGYDAALTPGEVWYEVYLEFLVSNNILTYNKAAGSVTFAGETFPLDQKVSRRLAMRVIYVLADKDLLKVPNFQSKGALSTSVTDTSVNISTDSNLSSGWGNASFGSKVGDVVTHPNGVKTKVSKVASESGKIGKEVFIEPIAETPGDWLIGPQVEFLADETCASGNTFLGSTGAQYDAGAVDGRAMAVFHQDLLFPYYYDTPPSGKSADYNTGYKWAYESVWDGHLALEAKCPAAADINLFNPQGWIKVKPEESSMSFFAPPSPHIISYQDYNPDSMLYTFEQLEVTTGPVISFGFQWASAPLTDLEWNKDKNLNISAIEFVELAMDGASEEPSVTAADFYELFKADLEGSVIGKQCTITDADIKEKTFNDNNAASLSFSVNCPGGATNIHLFYFYQLDSGNNAIFYFKNTNDISNDQGEILLDKVQDGDFVRQFMEGVE